MITTQNRTTTIELLHQAIKDLEQNDEVYDEGAISLIKSGLGELRDNL